jgi:hypothetical protein
MTTLQPAAPGPAQIERVNDVPTLVVNGSPFLLLGAQCDPWRSTPQDALTEAFFAGYHAMHATAVGIAIPWCKCEPVQDRYDFGFIDWFIHLAEMHRLKLVLQLFNSNVCGKVREADVSAEDNFGQTQPYGMPFTPAYILNHPDQYQQMVLPDEYIYDPGGPPMCPNDPRTLEREQNYVVKLAEHLKTTDTRRTVIMLQIDNELLYQTWLGQKPKDLQQVRCLCRWCEEKYDLARYSTPEEFMYYSFAEYIKVLTQAIKNCYNIPLYINSPSWEPNIISIFLENAPALDLIGVDGIAHPREPNWLSRSQVSRNIPLAAEIWTHSPMTRYNLDCLPYYTVHGQQGIGNLLWECQAPYTVVDDPVTTRKLSRALYPLKNALLPILFARGTDRFRGWYVLREFSKSVAKDQHGNLYPVPGSGKTTVVELVRTFVREGMQYHIEDGDHFFFSLGGVDWEVSDSFAGVIVQLGTGDYVLAIPEGKVCIRRKGSFKAEEGYFEKDQWQATGTCPVMQQNDRVIMRITEPKVIRFVFLY